MRLGTWVERGITTPYRLDVPYRWALHTMECPPETDPTSVARVHRFPPHFWVSMPKRIIVQTVDTIYAAQALAHPAGVETNHARAIQVEIAGYAKDVGSYPDRWWEWLRTALLHPVAEHHTINLAHQPEFCGSAQAYGARSSTRMADDEWLAFDGLCGHQHVPNNEHWDPGPIPAHLLVPKQKDDEDMTPELAKALADLEQRLTDEVNAAEGRILEKLPAKASWYDGIAKRLRAVQEKVGA